MNLRTARFEKPARHAPAAWTADPRKPAAACEHSTPWVRSLPKGQALTLASADQPRWLCVLSGRVWLTRIQDRGQSEDIWLDAGSAHCLAPGSRWIIEAWPDAWLSVAMELGTTVDGSDWCAA